MLYLPEKLFVSFGFLVLALYGFIKKKKKKLSVLLEIIALRQAVKN